MNPLLIIVRGIPGSGKSTFADQMSVIHGCRVFETDDYFMKNGVYVYRGDALAYYHGKCLRDAIGSVHDNGIAIVANCDIRWRDLKQTLRACREESVNVAICDVVGDFGSVHDIPEHRMDKIRQGFSMFPDLIPFFLRDRYTPDMIRSYAVVTPVKDGDPKIEYPTLDFNVKPAPDPEQ